MGKNQKLVVLSLMLLLGAACFFPILAAPELSLTPRESAEVKRLLAKASAAVTELSRSPHQRNMILALARAYWQLGDQAAARREVQTIRKKYEARSEANAPGPSRPAGVSAVGIAVMELTTLASEVAQFGDTADALKIMKEIGYQDPSGQALSMIGVKQAQAGDSRGAVQTALKIKPGRARDFAFSEIVSYDLHRQDVSGALLATAQMQDSPEKVEALVNISHTRILAGHRQAATRVVQEAQKVAFALPDVPPSRPQNFSVSYQCSPNASQSPNDRPLPRDQALPFAAQGQWELGLHAEAMATRKEIQSPYLQDQALFNFVKVDAEANRFAEAAQLVEKISFSPCRNSANASLASAQVAAGNVADGIATASRIEPASSLTWTSLALKAKDPAAAKALFARARTAALDGPSGLDRAEALYGVAALESSREGMHGFYCEDGAEAIRMAHQARTQRQVPSMDVIGGLRFNWVYSQIITWVNCGELEQAKALTLTDQNPSRGSEIGSIAAIETRNGDLQGAEKWAQSLQTPEDRANAFLGAAQGILQQVYVRAHKESSYQ